MVYRPLKDEYLFDVALKLYGDAVLGVQKILMLNPLLNIDDELYGNEIIYTQEPKRNKPVFVEVERTLTENYSSYDFQSIYDVSVQLFGDLSGIGYLSTVLLNLDSRVPLGTIFSTAKSNDPIVKYFKESRIIVQTEIVESGELGNFILMEDGTNILMEDGTGILLE